MVNYEEMSVNTLKTKLTWEKKKLATNEWSAGQQNIIRKIKTLEDIINRKGGMFCGCGRPLHGRGLCINCYSRWHYYAHPKHRNNIKSKEKRREIYLKHLDRITWYSQRVYDLKCLDKK